MLRRMLALALIAYSVVLIQGKQTPAGVEVPASTTLLLTAKGEGSQVYACTDGHWLLKAPDAHLLDAQGQIIGDHFAGPTWRLADGSEIKGKVIATQAAADSSSVSWLLLQAVPGSGKGRMAPVTYIRRTETHGGAAGSATCSVGEERVPYTATYSFYTAQ